MNCKSLDVFPRSLHKRGDSNYYMASDGTYHWLVVSGPDRVMFQGEEGGTQVGGAQTGGAGACSGADGGAGAHTAADKGYKLCPLSVENAKVIRKLFTFTNPVSHKGHKVTFGLGDRLGLASAGHIRLLRGMDVFPILAQQSIRELNLTGRNYDDVLAAAVWAVFREGYTKGYGADGDHLKTQNEVRYALDSGFTMITLDCSEHIRNDLAAVPQDEIDKTYALLPAGETSWLEGRYLGVNMPVCEDVSISFSDDEFRRMVLVYLPAIKHAAKIYIDLLRGAGADFEVSIDETLTTTSPQSHYFVANELIERGVEIASLAPRFVGEFQKGIDYRGDIHEFERDFLVHARIADKFGYKISVHSGSDKLSIYPFVSRQTNGRFHVKTAGTNWLEAVRVIAENDARLYREIHTFALENLAEAKKYYHITENVENIAALDSVPDSGLSGYLEQDDSRQVLHVTYGLILQARNADGTLRFRDRIYEVLNRHEAEYFAALERHIGKHLQQLTVDG